MLEAPAETVSTELDVNVYECNWCHMVYFTETKSPLPVEPGGCFPFAPHRLITNSATNGRWSDPKDGSTRIEQMRKCRVQNT